MEWLLIAALATSFGPSETQSVGEASELSLDALKACAEAEIGECQFRLAKKLQSGQTTNADKTKIKALYESAYRNGYQEASQEILNLISAGGELVTPPDEPTNRRSEPEANDAARHSSKQNAPLPTNALPTQSYKPGPIYPPDAASQGRVGEVVVGFKVDTDGNIHSGHIRRSSGHDDLDQAALVSINEWTLSEHDRSLFGTEVSAPISFSLDVAPPKYQLLDLRVGQSEASFKELVSAPQCQNNDDDSLRKCRGNLLTPEGAFKAIGIFSSGRLIAAEVRMNTKAQCKYVQRVSTARNGKPVGPMSSFFKALSIAAPGSFQFWGDVIADSNSEDGARIVGDGVMIVCKGGREPLWSAAIGPASEFAESPDIKDSDFMW